jgi:hypothetical protein
VRPVATSRDEPRHAATTVALPASQDESGHDTATTTDLSRQVATSSDMSIFEHPYVKRLEAEVDEFKSKYEKQVRRTESPAARRWRNILSPQKIRRPHPSIIGTHRAHNRG